MTPNSRHQRDALARRRQRPAQHRRGEVVFHRGPCGFRPLTAVERIFSRHALSPTINPVAVNGHEKDLAAERALEARFEKVDERHLNFTQSDGFNFHVLSNPFTRSKVFYHSDTATRLRDKASSPPTAPAETCRFPAGRVHSLAPLIHRRMLSRIPPDCDPAPLSRDLGRRRRPSSHKSGPERESQLGFR